MLTCIIKCALRLLVSIFFVQNVQAEIFSYELIVPNISGSFYKTVKFDFEGKCQAQVEKSFPLLSSYLSTAAEGSAQKTKKTLNLLQTYQAQVSSTCSLSVLEVDTIISAIYLHAGQDREKHEKMVSFLAFIQRQHVIQSLNSEVRLKHEVLKNPQIMGAYYCSQNIIWLDTTRPPLNLASILIHELEHWAMALLRTSYIQNGLSGKSLYLFEEYLSALNPSLSQVSFKSNTNRMSSSETRAQPSFFIDRNGLGWNLPRRFFKSNIDLNLYSSRGVLVKSWQKVIREKGIGRDLGYEDFLMNDFMNVEIRGKSSSLALLEMIEEVYFGNKTTDSQVVYKYLKSHPSFLKKFVNPLERIVSQSEQSWNYLGRPVCDDGTGPFPGGEGASMSDDRVKMMKSGIKACLTPHEDF